MKKSPPQLEAGYTKIANGVLESLMSFRFSGRQLRIILCIIRKTYGFHGKKKDMISLTQFEQMTGIDRIHCQHVLAQLVKMNVAEKSNTIPTTYSFQKYSSRWRMLPKMAVAENGVAKKSKSVAKNGDESVAENGKHKRKKINDTKERNGRSDVGEAMHPRTLHQLLPNRIEEKKFYEWLKMNKNNMIVQSFENMRFDEQIKIIDEWRESK